MMTTPTLLGEQAGIIFRAWVERTPPEEIKAALVLLCESGDGFAIDDVGAAVGRHLGWPEAFAAVALEPSQVLRVLDQAASQQGLVKDVGRS